MTGPFLSHKRAAEYCGIGVQTLYNLISKGRGPTHYKQGRLNTYIPVDLDQWMLSRLSERRVS